MLGIRAGIRVAQSLTAGVTKQANSIVKQAVKQGEALKQGTQKAAVGTTKALVTGAKVVAQVPPHFAKQTVALGQETAKVAVGTTKALANGAKVIAQTPSLYAKHAVALTQGTVQVAGNATKALVKGAKVVAQVPPLYAKQAVALTQGTARAAGAAVNGLTTGAAMRTMMAARNVDSFVSNGAMESALTHSPPTGVVASRRTASSFTQMPLEHGQKGESPNVTGLINSGAELAQFVWGGYNKGKHGPLSITPATLTQGGTSQPIYLVTLSGTEEAKGQSTSWLNNLPVALGVSNPLFVNARAAILKSVPAGATLVFAGHSQGGMVEQQLAADKAIQARYKVTHTVTFGSPLVSAGALEGKVHRVATRNDLVSYLNSPALLAALVPSRTVPGGRIGSMLGAAVAIQRQTQQSIPSDFDFNPGNSHVHDYTNELNPELMQMDALGRKVGIKDRATISLDPCKRLFFSSPLNTTER
ncbi:MAG: hypothetical protein EOO71_29325 [Myxococcaceae bacterium]|nr:MAG: hypothetical protein EOO71_29325 [Myxococcaceae bacterium]